MIWIYVKRQNSLSSGNQMQKSGSIFYHYAQNNNGIYETAHRSFVSNSLELLQLLIALALIIFYRPLSVWWETACIYSPDNFFLKGWISDGEREGCLDTIGVFNMCRQWARVAQHK